MTTNHLFAMTAAFGICAAASLAAQAGGQADRTTTRPVTVVGCLERNTSTATTATSSTTTSSDTTTAGTSGAERFVLVKGELGPAGATSWHRTKPDGPWYLVVGDGAELRRDAKKVVEVKGMLDTAGSVVGTSASATDGPSGTIRATSITVLSGSCGE